MIGLLLLCLLLVLLFGGLGLTVSPLFFVLVIVLILALGRVATTGGGASVELPKRIHKRYRRR